MNRTVTHLLKPMGFSPHPLFKLVSFSLLVSCMAYGTYCSLLFLPTLGFRLINRIKQASFKTLTLSTWIYVIRTVKKNRMLVCLSSLSEHRNFSWQFPVLRPAKCSSKHQNLRDEKATRFVGKWRPSSCSSVLVLSLGSFWEYINKLIHVIHSPSLHFGEVPKLGRFNLSKLEFISCKKCFLALLEVVNRQWKLHRIFFSQSEYKLKRIKSQPL